MPGDITVVGGGIAGCASALALAQAGWRVRLVEKGVLGCGASGAALGGLFPYTDKIRTKLAAVQRESIAAWPGYAAVLAGLAGVEAGDFFRDHGLVKQVGVGRMFEVFHLALGAVGVQVEEGFTGEINGPVLWCAGWGNARFFANEIEVVEGQALRVRSEVKAPVYGEEIYILPGWANGEAIVGSTKDRLAEPREMAVTAERTQVLLEKAGRLVPGLDKADVLEAWVGQRPSLKRGAAMLPLVREVNDGWAVVPLGGVGICLAPALSAAVARTVR